MAGNIYKKITRSRVFNINKIPELVSRHKKIYLKRSLTPFKEQMLIYYYYHVSADRLFLFMLGIRGTSTANTIETIATK